MRGSTELRNESLSLSKGAARPKLGGHEFPHIDCLRILQWCLTIYIGLHRGPCPHIADWLGLAEELIMTIYQFSDIAV